jgi:hypothetical protein
LTFGGTEIVTRVHVVHPLRQVFAFPNKLVPVQIGAQDGIFVVEPPQWTH